MKEDDANATTSPSTSSPSAFSPKWRLRYQKYGSFEEEERVVVFLEPHLLLDCDDMQVLEWRKEGDSYEPQPPEEAEERDEVVTVSEITKELDCAADDMKEGMEELTKMPFHQQQMFASNYRRLADCFK